MSVSPFSSSGVTSADIQDIKSLIQKLDTKITEGFKNISSEHAKSNVNSSTTTIASTKLGESGALLPPTPTPQDLSSIFLGKGGSSRRHSRRKSRRNRRMRKLNKH